MAPIFMVLVFVLLVSMIPIFMAPIFMVRVSVPSGLHGFRSRFTIVVSRSAPLCGARIRRTMCNRRPDVVRALPVDGATVSVAQSTKRIHPNCVSYPPKPRIRPNPRVLHEFVHLGRGNRRFRLIFRPKCTEDRLWLVSMHKTRVFAGVNWTKGTGSSQCEGFWLAQMHKGVIEGRSGWPECTDRERWWCVDEGCSVWPWVWVTDNGVDDG